jgi:peroxiredoxin
MKGLTVIAALLVAGAPAAKEGQEVIGRPAPSLEALSWVQGRVSDADLRGKVVLVRWWTNGCSLCKNTAPALNRLHADFAGKGLLVLGIYHPKPRPERRDPETIRAAVRALGFRFPVAVDEEWTVLRRWWLDAGERSYTSVSFLIVRGGGIRYIHPGGEFFPSTRPEERRQNADYEEIRSLVQQLLKEG